VIEEARPRIPSADLVDVLDALGNVTRLRALKLTAERPRSNQELAKLVGLTEAGMSKHLQKLAAVGLVATRRDGYYVLYSTDLERLRPLSGNVARIPRRRNQGGDCATCARQSVVLSVTRSAAKPSATLTVISVRRMPTLNASSAVRDTCPLNR
jgi:DNA-binding transcriptional ArsR family regulator